MKKHTISYVLIFSVVLLFMGCVTQPYKPIETTNIVEIPNQDQQTIYNKTRQWFSQYFVSGKSVVDYENPEAGTIIGNGVANVGSDPFGLIQYEIKYNIRIDTKDGKFRALTKIIEHTNTDSKSTYTVSNVSKAREAAAVEHVSKIVSDIENYVTDKKIDTKSDW